MRVQRDRYVQAVNATRDYDGIVTMGLFDFLLGQGI